MSGCLNADAAYLPECPTAGCYCIAGDCDAKKPCAPNCTADNICSSNPRKIRHVLQRGGHYAKKYQKYAK